jgi:HEAT repeat protein
VSRATLITATPLALLLLLVACGGGEEPAAPVTEEKSFAAEEETEPNPAPKVLSREEIVERERAREERDKNKLLRDRKHEYATNPDPERRAELLADLIQMAGEKPESIRPEIENALGSKSAELRAYGVEAAARCLPASDARPAVRKALADEEAEVRTAAAQAWPLIEGATIDALVARTGEEFDEHVLAYVCAGIAKLARGGDVAEVGRVLENLIRPEDAIPLLKWAGAGKHVALTPQVASYVTMGEEGTQVEAIRALVALGGTSEKAVYDQLLFGLEAPAEEVRKEAFRALVRLSGKGLPFDHTLSEEERAPQVTAWRKALGRE